MRKFFTENRVLAFIQIAVAFGAGSGVIATIHFLSSVPWLYLAAIFCFVSAASATLLYRVVGYQRPGEVPPGSLLQQQRQRPARRTVYQELASALSAAEKVRRDLKWERMGHSLAVKEFHDGLRLTIHARLPEHRDEFWNISMDNRDDLEMMDATVAALRRLMTDPAYREGA